MSMTVQPIEVRSILDHPFKVPNTYLALSTFSGQSVTVSGTTVLVVGVVASQNISGTITTENSFIPTFTEAFTPSFVGTFFAITIALIKRIDHDGKSLQLTKAIPANVSYQDGEYFCRNEELGIVTMSPTLDECIEDFKEEILFVWNEYGKASDEMLTDGAKELKRRIQQYLGK